MEIDLNNEQADKNRSTLTIAMLRIPIGLAYIKFSESVYPAISSYGE